MFENIASVSKIRRAIALGKPLENKQNLLVLDSSVSEVKFWRLDIISLMNKPNSGIMHLNFLAITYNAVEKYIFQSRKISLKINT